MHEITNYIFDMQEIRTLTDNRTGDPWFVAKDVCTVLGIAMPHRAVSRLDVDERHSMTVTDSLGRQQETTIINESGLYSLILTSRKPQAKAFKKWITSVVLPSIRKTGSQPAQPKQLSRMEILQMALEAEQKVLELEQKVEEDKHKVDLLVLTRQVVKLYSYSNINALQIPCTYSKCKKGVGER